VYAMIALAIFLCMALSAFAQVAPSAGICWNTADKTTKFSTVTSTCKDGTQLTQCACNSGGFNFPAGTCASSSIAQYSFTGCTTPACPPGQRRQLGAPADPANGKCCPSYDCVFPQQDPPVPRPNPSYVAPSAQVCWDQSRGNDVMFGKATVACADGKQSEACLCNTEQYLYAPGTCAGSTVDRILSSAECTLFLCKEGEKAELLSAASPTNGNCCPSYKCVPARTGWMHLPGRSGASANEADPTQFSSSTNSEENSTSVPAFAIALCVIGALVVVLLLVVIVLLVSFIRKH